MDAELIEDEFPVIIVDGDTHTADPEAQTITALTTEVTVAVGDLMAAANQLVVATPQDAQVATDFMNNCADGRKRVKAKFDELTRPIFDHHKRLCALRDSALARFADPEAVAKRKLVAWNVECRRIEAEQRRVAEVERQRLMDEQRQARALEAEKKGNHEQAAKIIEGKTPEPVPVVVMPAPVEKPRNATFTETRTPEVFDLRLLCEAIGKGEQPLTMVEACLPVLRKLAIALGDQFNVPGVRVIKGTSVRGGRR